MILVAGNESSSGGRHSPYSVAFGAESKLFCSHRSANTRADYCRGYDGAYECPDDRANTRSNDRTHGRADDRLNYDGVVPTTEADEFVEITNRGTAGQSMANWRLVSVVGNQVYSFPAITIAAGQACRVYTNQNHAEFCGLSWRSGSAIWNNTGDRADLVNPSGLVVSSVGYGGQ